MNPMTFLFVVVILFTVQCVTPLTDGFKPRTESKNQRLFKFGITTGMAIWGWLIYFG